MGQFIPQAQLGPFYFGPNAFTSGYGHLPTKIDGAERDSYVIEHEIPGREGGIVEYLGSKQPTYKIQGFLTNNNDLLYGPAGYYCSGATVGSLIADDAKAFLQGLRGSGLVLLKLESTYSNYSGYANLYENDFFYIKNETFAMEAGRGYPYYPFTFDLIRGSYKTYGNSSGTTLWNTGDNPYFSGYIIAWQQISGFAQGETINNLGIQVNSVASGHMSLALYRSSDYHLLAQSTVQNVHSGWNYFQLNPSYQTSSGTAYVYAVVSDIATQSGITVLQYDKFGTGITSYQSGYFMYVSGIGAYAGFPAIFAPGTFNEVSGSILNMVMVAPG